MQYCELLGLLERSVVVNWLSISEDMLEDASQLPWSGWESPCDCRVRRGTDGVQLVFEGGAERGRRGEAEKDKHVMVVGG